MSPISSRLLVPRTSAAFSGPKDIPNLALWLDAADDATLFDAPTGGSLPAAGATIGRWEDKSGNSRHAVQNTVPNRPIRRTSLLNGNSGVHFTGSPVTMPTAAFAVPSAFTLFVVQRNTTQFQPGSARCVEHGSAFTSGWNAVGASLGMAGGSYVWQARFNATTLDTNTSTAPANYIIQYTSDGAATKNLSLTFNNGAASTFTSTATPQAGNWEFWLGSLAGSFFHSIQYVHEIVYYSNLLSTGQRNNVVSYLNTKWAVF